MITAKARAKDGSLVIVTRTPGELVGRAAECCGRPFMQGGFVVGDEHAECACYPNEYDRATSLIVEREREATQAREQNSRHTILVGRAENMVYDLPGPSRR